MSSNTPCVMMPSFQAATAPVRAPAEVTSSAASFPFHIFPSQKMWQRASTCVVAYPWKTSPM